MVFDNAAASASTSGHDGAAAATDFSNEWIINLGEEFGGQVLISPPVFLICTTYVLVYSTVQGVPNVVVEKLRYITFISPVR